jgi:hypothetical protein
MIALAYDSNSNLSKQFLKDNEDVVGLELNKPEIFERISKCSYKIVEVPVIFELVEDTVSKFEGLDAYRYMSKLTELRNAKKEEVETKEQTKKPKKVSLNETAIVLNPEDRNEEVQERTEITEQDGTDKSMDMDDRRKQVIASKKIQPNDPRMKLQNSDSQKDPLTFAMDKSLIQRMKDENGTISKKENVDIEQVMARQ